MSDEPLRLPLLQQLLADTERENVQEQYLAELRRRALFSDAEASCVCVCVCVFVCVCVCGGSHQKDTASVWRH